MGWDANSLCARMLHLLHEFVRDLYSVTVFLPTSSNTAGKVNWLTSCKVSVHTCFAVHFHNDFLLAILAKCQALGSTPGGLMILMVTNAIIIMMMIIMIMIMMIVIVIVVIINIFIHYKIEITYLLLHI